MECCKNCNDIGLVDHKAFVKSNVACAQGICHLIGKWAMRLDRHEKAPLLPC